MSSRSKHSLLGFCGFGLTALGFFLGRHTAGSAVKSSASIARTNVARTSAVMTENPSSTFDRPGQSTATAIGAWETFQRQISLPASEEARCVWLKELGATDYAQALQFAQQAATPRQREIFRCAALQGWATQDPEAAARWALANVRTEDRRAAIEAVAAGAIAQPDKAISAINHLIEADPLQASDHGNALVMAFARAGSFELGSKFANSGPLEYRAAWLCTVFNQWAMYQPEAALAALGQINDSGARGEALQGVIAGWSASDPAGLVAHAQTLPSGEERLFALRDGLQQWVHRDPAAATAWMDQHDPNPDLDAGAAAVAVMPALVERKPDVAASWAESIVDPELRANTLLDLIRLWGARDVVAARRYAATTTALSPDRRELALSALEPSP